MTPAETRAAVHQVYHRDPYETDTDQSGGTDIDEDTDDSEDDRMYNQLRQAGLTDREILESVSVK